MANLLGEFLRDVSELYCLDGRRHCRMAGVGTTEEPQGMKKPAYKIIEADSAELLAEAVNKALEEGWDTVGGVAVTVSNVAQDDRDRESSAFYCYYQAVLK